MKNDLTVAEVKLNITDIAKNYIRLARILF